MAESHALFALKDKYAHLAGELKATQAREAAIKAGLVHLRETIKLFDEDCDTGDIGSIGPAHLSRWFTPGECSRTTLDIMREATDPLSARQIAIEVMRRCEIPTDKPGVIKRVTYTVFDALRRREGTLFTRGGTQPTVWAKVAVSPDCNGGEYA